MKYYFITIILLVLHLPCQAQEETQKAPTQEPVDLEIEEDEILEGIPKELTPELQKDEMFFELNEEIEHYDMEVPELMEGIDLIQAQKRYENQQILKEVQKAERTIEFVQEADLLQEDSLGQGEGEQGDTPLPEQKNVENQTVEDGQEVMAPTALSLGRSELEFSRKRLRGPSQFDSRIEVRRLQTNISWQLFILRRTRSIGIVVEKNRLKKVADSIYQVKTPNKLGEILQLCKTEPFQEQPVIGVGTAFITADQQMLTARHVFTKSLDNFAVVFGFELANKSGIVETIIHARDIYFPQEVVTSSKTYDITIFELDRPLPYPALRWENSGSLQEGSEIYMIGHPTGLPKKIALNANITDNSHPQYFYTSLDSFQGNSGSPVFHFNSHRVIGVLVSGELDYHFNGSCYESKLCVPGYCKGEKVMRIENILNN